MLFPSTLYILASARVAPFLVVGASPCGPEDSAAPAENNNGHEKIVTVTVTVEATSSAVVPHKPWEDNQQGSEPGNGHNTGKLSSPAPTWSSQSSSSTSGHSESSVTTSRPLLPVEMLTWRCNTFLSPGNPQQIPTSTSTSVVTITLTSTITPTTTITPPPVVVTETASATTTVFTTPAQTTDISTTTETVSETITETAPTSTSVTTSTVTISTSTILRTTIATTSGFRPARSTLPRAALKKRSDSLRLRQLAGSNSTSSDFWRPSGSPQSVECTTIITSTTTLTASTTALPVTSIADASTSTSTTTTVITTVSSILLPAATTTTTTTVTSTGTTTTTPVTRLNVRHHHQDYTGLHFPHLCCMQSRQ